MSKFNINKITRRVVSFEEGKSFARQNDLLFCETSAKEAQNINEVQFFKIKKVLLKYSRYNFLKNINKRNADYFGCK